LLGASVLTRLQVVHQPGSGQEVVEVRPAVEQVCVVVDYMYVCLGIQKFPELLQVDLDGVGSDGLDSLQNIDLLADRRSQGDGERSFSRL